ARAVRCRCRSRAWRTRTSPTSQSPSAAPDVPAAAVDVVVTSSRVAPGLLTSHAWEVLHAADRVFAPVDDLGVAAVRAAGIEVSVVPLSEVGERRAYGPRTVWLAPLGELDWAGHLRDHLADELTPAGVDAETVTEVTGSYDLPGARALDLVAVMSRLRR